MALVPLNIPGEPAPERRRRDVVGIDLGTTNSLVATVVDGKPKVIAGEGGARRHPSVVRYLADGDVVVGDKAKEAMAEFPDEVVASVKRLMGRGANDVSSSYQYKYEASDGMAKVRVGDRTVSPVEVSAEILRHLLKAAGALFGAESEAAVITVPAYFDDAQRQATKDAARLAGIEVLRLLNEPTAAALAHGLDRGEEGVYAVYDLGGGTFDVSVLRLSRGIFEVLGTAGDSALGGDDYDEALLRHVHARTGADLPTGACWRLAVRQACTAKEAVCTGGTATLEVAGNEVPVGMDDLAAATKNLTDRTVGILLGCLSDCGVGEELKGVIMVGGATRMGLVRDAVAAAVSAPLHLDLDPDEVVALGAAAQADILAGNRSGDDWLLLDVVPLSLGIETMGGLVEKIISRNSPIPITRAQEFTTHKDGQTAMSVHVVQGERELVADCRSLARFSVRGIPPMAAGTARIRVTYRADADGILSVTAREMRTGAETGIEVKPSYGLTEDEVAGMIKSSVEHAKEDIGARSLAEARSEAQSLDTMIAAAMASAADLVGDDRQAIEEARSRLAKAMDGDDVGLIRDATRALDRASEGFAARRMEHAVAQALTGAKVDDLA